MYCIYKTVVYMEVEELAMIKNKQQLKKGPIKKRDRTIN
jgi:hypothetical protein